ncbi:MAG: FAD-dependent oxidoreductase [Akkermansiaceae bacterium]|nr:FAD-dependent oxidoreductase [Armatimonadota bacterium]
MRFLALVLTVLIAMTTASESAIAATGNAVLAAPPKERRVLDVQNRRVVLGERFPSDVEPTCDVLILGGGTGGIAAAEAVARRYLSVILVEPTASLGGQLTAQLVSAPDENSHIEKKNGPSTASYRRLRERVRELSAALPDAKPGAAKNIGQGWVSRICAPPELWGQAIRERVAYWNSNRGIKRVYLRHQVRAIETLSNGLVNYADVVNLDTGKMTRIGARYMIDATEDGEALHLAGCPTTIGQEARFEYNEAHAPEEARPDWVQSFTYCFLLNWQSDSANRTIVEQPAEYEYFKSLGEYTLDYVYSERGTVTYKVLVKAEGSGGPFWTYRRLLAANSFTGAKSPEDDVALMNWRGNDFHEETYLGKPLDEQARILERGRQFAQGFCWWLQNECPRDDGSGFGYPEMQLVLGSDESLANGIGKDGFAVAPYVRESRRLLAASMLTENDMVAPPDNPGAKWGTEFPDSVGCALYAVDIHPTKGEPHLLLPAIPYHLPLGAFLTTDGPANILPGAKNFGATRLALASARMHPTEWLAGEIAGTLAAFCIGRDMNRPNPVRDSPEMFAAFQAELREMGIEYSWRNIIPE